MEKINYILISLFFCASPSVATIQSEVKSTGKVDRHDLINDALGFRYSLRNARRDTQMTIWSVQEYLPVSKEWVDGLELKADQNTEWRHREITKWTNERIQAYNDFARQDLIRHQIFNFKLATSFCHLPDFFGKNDYNARRVWDDVCRRDNDPFQAAE